ncbi:hypothetical protein BG000_010260 [Podila horticola]|nr:hypothetical protein BG000_010260 [Podila horticola]
MDDPLRHHHDETTAMAELVDPPQSSKCLTLSAIVLFLAIVASSIPNVLSPQPRNVTSVAKASSSVVSSVITTVPGQQQQQVQQALLSDSFLYASPQPSPSQATDRRSPEQPQPIERSPQPEQQQQQQQREPLIEKTTVLELVLIAINFFLRVAFWVLSLIYRSCRYVVVQPTGIIMRLLETPLEMMREIYKTVMPVYSFFTVAAIIGVVVGGSATWVAQLWSRHGNAPYLLPLPLPRVPRHRLHPDVDKDKGKDDRKRRIPKPAIPPTKLPLPEHKQCTMGKDRTWPYRGEARDELRHPLGDPVQLLRVSGKATKLVTNPESYSFNEDPKNLMPWASDPAIKIDRFDGRALLDYLPAETPAMVDSGLRMERDEDGIGDELRFERWFDLVEKSRLHISEEQCLAEIEEEWNDLVARHHALIGKTPEKKSETSTGSFGFNYGTKIVQNDDEGTNVGQLMDRELPAMEQENILEHLDQLSQQDRDTLDQLGAEFSIKDYYRMLRIAKRDQDDRVRQLKVTAVNLERAMAGKKPLKMSEIPGLEPEHREGSRQGKRRRHRDRSYSPAYRSTRRSSPSYAPYDSDSSRSGSESPKKEDTLEFISEFKNDSNAETSEDDGIPDSIPDSDRFKRTKMGASPLNAKRLSSSSATVPSLSGRPSGVSSGSSTITPTKGVEDMKLSLVEKLKQRMRQGLESEGERPNNCG